ncbi:MAG: ImmA/IrrE family metallo-endopeptidase, partial [Candidatus Peribacteraceae bacterium]|nr:ImmA/IrrE family metallo-endopeptidase [Candidatus Peribacteraceae bacterium]
ALCLIHHGHPNLPALGVAFEIDPVSSPGDMAFLYDDNAPFFKKRWTIAHEIGHCCMGHVSSIGAPSTNLPGAMEQEAQAFAGALLIPPSDLRKFAKGKKPTILMLQQRYLVTKPMATVAIIGAKVLNFIKA